MLAMPMPTNDNRDNLQLFLNGFFEESGLSDPTTVMSCLDDATVLQFTNFIPQSLHDGCHLSLFSLSKFSDEIKNFMASLSPDVNKCLAASDDIKAL